MSSYMTFKIISLIVSLVILVIVLVNKASDKKQDSKKSDNNQNQQPRQPQRSQQHNNMKCPYCGYDKIQPNFNFCPRCNRSLKEQGTAPQHVDRDPQQPQQPQLSKFQLKRLGLHRFEYTLLPTYVDLLKSNPVQEVRLIDSSLWKKDIESIANPQFIDWDEISCEILGDSRTECVFFYDFPTPFDIPLAKYGAIYINKQKQIYKYYTLEKSAMGFMICSPSTEGHINYGEKGDMSKKEFLNEVCNLLGIDAGSMQGWRLAKGKASVVHYTDFGGGKKEFSEADLNIMTELKDNNYEDFIENNPLAVICFYEYRGPSKLMLNLLSEFADDYKERISVGKYDVYGDKNETVRERLHVTAMPTFLIYKHGEVVKKHIGLCPRDIMNSWFEELLP